MEDQSPYKSKSITVVKDSVLAEGVVYRNLLARADGRTSSIHLVEADMSNPFLSIEILKGKNLADGLETVHDMVARFDSSYTSERALAATNAHFWAARNHYPMGPAIIDGEIVQMKAHSLWNSVFFDDENKAYIDWFDISGKVEIGSETLEIASANWRERPEDLVLYNRFIGDSIPRVKDVSLEEEIEEAEEDYVFSDTTDYEFDAEELRRNLIARRRADKEEFPLLKIVLEYLTFPAVNEEIVCRVVEVKRGAVAVPLSGCVLVAGESKTAFIKLKKGDQIILKFETNVHKDRVFYNSVSGTPRLVRDGKARHEASREGVRSRRFIRYRLPRTAIGVSEDRTKIYIVAVESGDRKKGTSGCSLASLAEIMKKIGAYNAMNLDGGGSSAMVINNYNLVARSDPTTTRRVTTSLAVTVQTTPLKNIFRVKY